MMSNTAMYLLLVQLSFFALGAMSVAVALLYKYKPPYWWAYALVKFGAVLIVAVILWLVLPSQSIDPAPRVWWYIGGVAAIAVGTVGVVRDLMKRFGRRSAKEVSSAGT